MKKLIAIALVLSLVGGTAMTQKKSTPKTQKEKVSYSIGMNLGKNMDCTLSTTSICKAR